MADLSEKVDLEEAGLFNQTGFGEYFKHIWDYGIGQHLSDIEATYNLKDHLVFSVKESSDPIYELFNEYENFIKVNNDLDRGCVVYTDEFVIDFNLSERNNYYTLEYNLAAIDKKTAEEEEKRIRSIFPFEVDKPLVEINWRFPSARGPVMETSFRDVIREDFYEQAYPTIDNIEEWIEKYLNSDSSLMFMYGPPGTGKTKLIRKILKETPNYKKEKREPEVTYISGEKTVSYESVFVNFLNGNSDFLVIEDLDQKVKPRSEGNEEMSTLLTVSDGIVSSLGKKIIITTNLPSLDESRIDDALLRTGRCFDVKKMRKLSSEEAIEFYKKVFGDNNVNKIKSDTYYPLSDLYYLGKNGHMPEENSNDGPGFKLT